MAKVNYGTIVNDARGKVNGTVFSKNKSGSYTRRKVTPANPNTPAQSRTRTNFGALSQAWSGSLTDSDRAAWINFANTYPRLDVFGNSIQITGLNMYLSLNQVLANLGVTSVDTPPGSNVVTPIAFDPTSIAAAVTGSLLTFEQTAAYVGTNEFYVFGARPLPPGRQPANSDFRFIGVLTPTSSGSPPYTINAWTIYSAKFGPPIHTQRISLLVATVDPTTGLTTVGAKMSSICGA